MKPFEQFPLDTGVLYDYSKNQYPSKLHGWANNYRCHGEASTFYGFVLSETIIQTNSGDFVVGDGMYFSVPKHCQLLGGHGIIIERIGHVGVFSLGGPIESTGRLKYIDGCTDSLLIPPIKLGDPCLNALYFPAGIDQTMHTHPSMRVGVVVSGHGECVTPDEFIPLKPGTVFIIHQEGQHKFRTLNSDGMVVIAYHPDSDYGPRDEEHPMINRTIVNGVSASQIEAIRTK